ncbi:MAG: TIGR00266 family protein [Anaerolineae bacterium]|nr:TIGR00266 family protein [Anaerolineae bacterium]
MSDYTNQPGQRLDLPDPVVTLTGRTVGGADYQIIGTVMQAVTVRMNRSHQLYSEVGSLSWMSDGVQMDTNLGNGGLFGALGRVFTGESLFVVNYSSTIDGALVTFSSDFPGKIIPVNLAQGQSMIAQKDTLLAAEKSVNLSIAFQKRLGAGLFGGEGFILQKFEGPGTLFAGFDGEIVEYTLQAGQNMLVDTGHLAMFEPSVSYDITMVKGIKNLIFGGEGLFLVRLTGPGRIWLQTMPISKLAGVLRKYMPRSEGKSDGPGINLSLGG